MISTWPPRSTVWRRRIAHMADELKLDAIEARVLGVLIEKDQTTPEQYPCR